MRRGRSKLVFVGVKFEPTVLARVDALAALDQRTRSWVLRQLVGRALAQVARMPQVGAR